jgi:signal transduction histidine kinase
MKPEGGGESTFTRSVVSERAAAEQVIAIGLLTVRSLHIFQGAVCLATGWKAYKRPRLALGLLAASCVEAAFLTSRSWRGRAFRDSRLAWFDAGYGATGLCLMAVATQDDDRTAWLNWMCPLTFGTTAAATVAIEGSAATAVPAMLAGVYLATVRRNIVSGGSQLATALANTTSYFGFYVAARGFGGRLRGDSLKIEHARNETLVERERLAAERQRNHEHRLLHDSALQTLELIASGNLKDIELIRRQAKREAALLRRAISATDPADSGLCAGVQDVVDSCSEEGLHIDLALIDADVEVNPATAEALLGALRESLTNVAKHSGTSHAVVNLSTAENGVRIIVRDHGEGFDQKTRVGGFGTKNSIIARLEEVGGKATISSAPEHGTKVTLWAPL